MQKMRVSPMRIIKTDGHYQTERSVVRDEDSRKSLRERLIQIETKYRERMSMARSAQAGGRRTVPKHATRRMIMRTEELTLSRWRRDVALQAGVCALILLSVLGFRAVDTGVTNRITDGITKAVTMEMDFSENLGELQFVRNIMPESVLTFWANTADAPGTLLKPMDGEIVVSYTDKLPGILIVGVGDSVLSAADGEVSSITRSDEGDYVLKVKHSGGVETLYGFLQGIKVAEGERVREGQEVGVAMPAINGSQLYFQAIKDGTPYDPAPVFRK